jgi:quercetin dioxygenase-like cupin family protein
MADASASELHLSAPFGPQARVRRFTLWITIQLSTRLTRTTTTMPTATLPQVLRAARDARFNRERFAPHVLFENEHLRAVLAALDEGQSIPLHAPALDLVVAVVDGTGELAAGDAVHHVRAGDVAVVPAGARRGLRASGGRMVALLVVSPPPGAAHHAVQHTPWPPAGEDRPSDDAPASSKTWSAASPTCRQERSGPRSAER